MENNGFVFFRSVWDGFQELKRKDENLAIKYLYAVIEYGLDGEYDESDPVINALMSNTIIGIDNAHSRRAASQDNGAKGGRPKQYSSDRINELMLQGKTNQQIADELGCSIKTIQRAVKEIKSKNPQTFGF